MRNILKMNFFRMRRTKTTYILAVIGLAFSLMFLGINILTDAVMTDLMGEVVVAENNVLESVMLQFTIAIVPMLALMYIMLFLNSEVSSGYAKNIVGYEGNKYALAGANFITAALYGTVIFLAATAVGVGFAALALKTPVFSDWGKFISYIAVSLIEMYAFIGLFIAFADMKGKYVLLMIIGAVCFMYAMLLYELVDLAFSYFFDIQFSLENYTLLGCMTMFRLTNKYSDFIISGAIALAVLILAYFLDVLALKRRELR